MNKFLPALTVILLLSVLGTEASADGVDPRTEEQQKTDQVIVEVKGGADGQFEGTDKVSMSGTDALLSVDVPENRTVEAFIAEMESNGAVEHAEPDFLVKSAYVPNDPDAAAMQYHHQKLGTNQAWDKTRGTEDVIVAVIDNGIDAAHPELKNQIVNPFDTVKETSSIAAGIHGTHVAGIIASSIDNGIGGAGVAPGTKIMPINVFDGDFAYISEIIEGIYRAVDQGADIINLSMGSYEYSPAFNEAIQAAHQKGVVIVAAAGNDQVDAPFYPASYPNVISVASSTAEDDVSLFSNFGVNIDITAPGSSIYSTLPEGAFGVMDGTSMAAPMVTGTAALIKASDPALTNAEIESRLYGSADDLGAAGKDPVFGHGRVNAQKALLINFLPAPSVDPVAPEATSITGKTAPGTRVVVYAEDAELGEAAAEGGTFTVPVPKLKPDVSLSVYATSVEGIKSASVTVKAGE